MKVFQSCLIDPALEFPYTCTKCGGPVLNYDPSSTRYQGHYGRTLSVFVTAFKFDFKK